VSALKLYTASIAGNLHASVPRAKDPSINASAVAAKPEEVSPSAGLRELSPVVLLRACRPRQWSKNVLVAAAPLSAGVIGRADVVAEVLVAFVAFCMLSSATYLLNDVRDRAQDREHPRKRLRPVAAGEMSVPAAIRWAASLAVLGLATAAFVRPMLALVGIGYMALTASYSLWWRRVVVGDIVAVAAGFVVRACAGGAATHVPLSRWFLVVTSACACFLVAGKRYAELTDHGRALTRATLRRYSAEGLVALLGVAVAVAVVGYGMWSFQRPEHGPWYELSLIPFAGWLARYARLLQVGAGQAPEEVILGDQILVALGLTWLGLFLGGVYVGG
jgi:decaprenyl-phosphate phosphoribosyltransferase